MKLGLQQQQRAALHKITCVWPSVRRQLISISDVREVAPLRIFTRATLPPQLPSELASIGYLVSKPTCPETVTPLEVNDFVQVTSGVEYRANVN